MAHDVNPIALEDDTECSLVTLANASQEIEI
jgi:hypothetical protein